ncbi:MAG: methanogenesis marker 17 protein [Methanobacterium sp.]|uniref:methanogenesis marker 17 protein n=1 Tax=Methanobacterium sp. TaxID=2164 RepID=UPI003D64A09F|nr:methanogenesis marker 17 protein [Methanobacterium sp.]
MLVECYDEDGAEVYEMIIKQIIQDVQVSRAIDDMKVFVDPREPVFIIVVKFKKAASPITIDDFTEYKYDKNENKIYIKVKDETYLPELLKKLWETEGREKIQQPSRFEVTINGPKSEIKGIVIHDPKDDLKKKIYDAIFRIIPEGFKVIRHNSKEDIIAMVCSDEIIKDEWIKKEEKMIKDLT